MPGPTFHSLAGLGGGTTTDALTFTTERITPSPNRLILIWINAYMATGSAQPPTPTVTGNGITYTLEKAQDIDNAGTDRSTLFLFRGMSSAPTQGTVLIDFGATTVGNCSWRIDQSSADVDTTGTNGSGAIAQTTVGATSSTTVTTSPTTTFGSSMTSGNTAVFGCGIETSGPQTPRSSWTELGDLTTVSLCGIETQYLNTGTDTAGSSTWSTTARAGAILVEVKSGATSPNGLVVAHASSVTTSVNALLGVSHGNAVTGDIEILAEASDSTQTLTIDALFTQLASLTDGGLRAYVGSNISDGTESGDVSISSGATANRQAAVLATYRGYNSSITNVTSLAETSGSNVTSHSSPSITPTNNNSGIVLIYTDRVTTSVLPTAPAGYTVRASFATSGSGGTTVVVADKLSGLTSGTPESPAAWTGATTSTTAYVIALELVPASSSQTATGDQAATATVSGAATGSKSVSGDASVSSALSGVASLAKSAVGTLAAVAALTGAATGVKPVLGDLAAAVLATGAASVAKTSSGNVTTTAAITGSATTAAIQTATGDRNVTADLSGAALTDHQSTGDLSVTAAASGAASIGQSASGDLSAVAALAGAAVSTKAATGDISATAALMGEAEVFGHFDPAVRTTAMARRLSATASARATSTATARRPSATATVRSPA